MSSFYNDKHDLLGGKFVPNKPQGSLYDTSVGPVSVGTEMLSDRIYGNESSYYNPHSSSNADPFETESKSVFAKSKSSPSESIISRGIKSIKRALSPQKKETTHPTNKQSTLTTNAEMSSIRSNDSIEKMKQRMGMKPSQKLSKNEEKQRIVIVRSPLETSNQESKSQSKPIKMISTKSSSSSKQTVHPPSERRMSRGLSLTDMSGYSIVPQKEKVRWGTMANLGMGDEKGPSQMVMANNSSKIRKPTGIYSPQNPLELSNNERNRKKSLPSSTSRTWSNVKARVEKALSPSKPDKPISQSNIHATTNTELMSGTNKPKQNQPLQPISNYSSNNSRMKPGPSQMVMANNNSKIRQPPRKLPPPLTQFSSHPQQPLNPHPPSVPRSEPQPRLKYRAPSTTVSSDVTQEAVDKLTPNDDTNDTKFRPRWSSLAIVFLLILMIMSFIISVCLTVIRSRSYSEDEIVSKRYACLIRMVHSADGPLLITVSWFSFMAILCHIILLLHRFNYF